MSTFSFGNFKPESERRLCSFGWKEFREQNKGTEERVTRRQAYKEYVDQLAGKADEIAQEEQKGVFGGRGDAPEVDLDHAPAHAALGLEALTLVEQNPDVPQQDRILVTEAKKLMYQFKGDEERDIKGLVFKWDGANLSLVSGDPELVAAALDYVAGQKAKYVNDGKVVTERDAANESLESFNARVEYAKKLARERQRFSADLVSERMNVYDRLSDVLRKYKSQFETYEAIRKDIAEGANPADKIRQYEEEQAEVFGQFKKERPYAYVQLLRDAAKQDASILADRETELTGKNETVEDGVVKIEQMHLYLTLLEEAAESSPSAVRYYPDRLKRMKAWVKVENDREQYIAGEPKVAGLGVYRELVKAAVAEDPDLYLTLVLPEYSKYWEADVPANDALGKKEQSGADIFAEVTKIAIAKNPAIFFAQGDMPNWREYMNFDLPSQFNAFVKGMDFKTRLDIYSAIPSREAASAFEGYDGGVIQYLKDLYDDAASPDDKKLVLRAIVMHEHVEILNGIKAGNDPFYQELKALAVNLEDQDIREALNVSDLLTDEDLVMTALTGLNAKLAALKAQYEGNEKQFAAESAKLMMQNQEILGNIPPVFINTPEFKREMMAIIAHRGELFKDMPMSWRIDRDMCLAAVNASASAYVGVHEQYRSDPHIILAAMRAEKAGHGNMHWKDVPQAFIDTLKKDYNFVVNEDGMISDPQLLQEIIMGLEYEVLATKDEEVSSPFDAWGEEEWSATNLEGGKDALKTSIISILNEPDSRPEYILDLSEELRHDVAFMQQLIEENPDNFKFMDHGYFAGKPEYFKPPNGLAFLAVGKDPALIKYADPSVSENVAVLCDYAERYAGATDGRLVLSRLMRHLTTEQVLTADTFNKLIVLPMFDGDLAQLVTFLEDLFKKEIDGVTLLQMIPAGSLTGEKGETFLAAYFRAHPDQLDQFGIIPPDMMQNEEFVAKALFAQPKLFQHIDHEYWSKKPDVYQAWAKEAYKQSGADILQYANDVILTDVAFLAEMADGDLLALEGLIAQVPPRMLSQQFVSDLVDLLEKDFHEALAKRAPSNTSGATMPERIYDFVEHHVFNDPDNSVKAVMRFWPEEWKRDKALVLGHLRDKATLEDLPYVDPVLLINTEFVNELIGEFGYDVFQHINHEAFYQVAPDDYKLLVAKVLKEKPEMFKYTLAELQENQDFMWDLSDGEIGNGKGDLDSFLRYLKTVSPVTRGTHTWLISVIELIGRENPDKVLTYLQTQVLPDPAYTSPDVIHKILSANDNALMKKLLVADPTFFYKVSKEYFAGPFLTELSVLLLNQPAGEIHVLQMINTKMEPNVRRAFIESHPRLILDLHKDRSWAIVDFLREDNLTVTFLQHAVAYYNDADARGVLLSAMKVKPGVTEGMLMLRPDLFVNSSEYVQSQFAATLGEEAVAAIRAEYQRAEAERVDPFKEAAELNLLKTRNRLTTLVKVFTPQQLNDEFRFIKLRQVVGGGGGIGDYKFAEYYSILETEYATLNANPDRSPNAVSTLTAAYSELVTFLEAHLTVDNVVAPGTETVAPQLLLEDSGTESFGRTLNPNLENMQMLVSLKKKVETTPWQEFEGEDVEAKFKERTRVSRVIANEMKARFEGLRAALDNNDPTIRESAARDILWMLDNWSVRQAIDYSYIEAQALTSRDFTLIRREANAILESLSTEVRPRPVGEPLKNEAYYNLTKPQRSFVELMTQTFGDVHKEWDKYHYAEIISATKSEYASEVMTAVLNNVRSAPARNALQQRFEAFKPEHQIANPMQCLQISVELLSVVDAPKIIAALPQNEVLQADTQEAVDVVSAIATDLGFTFDATVVAQYWEMRATRYPHLVKSKPSVNRGYDDDYSPAPEPDPFSPPPPPGLEP